MLSTEDGMRCNTALVFLAAIRSPWRDGIVITLQYHIVTLLLLLFRHDHICFWLLVLLCAVNCPMLVSEW